MPIYSNYSSTSTESSSSSSSNSDDSEREPKRSRNKNKYTARKRFSSTPSIESHSSTSSKFKKTISKSQRNGFQYKNRFSSSSNFSEESHTTQEPSYEDEYSKSYRESSGPDKTHEMLPEDDRSASRNLYIGNLNTDITSSKLHAILERYGHVIRVEIMYGKLSKERIYAFAKFLTVDMAYKAKVALSGQFLTKFRCNIGYAIPKPTERIWIGGLESSITTSEIKTKFRKFGRILKIDHSEGDDQCYIMYDSIDVAYEAVRKMRGFSFAGSERRLRTDYADIPPNDLENRRSNSRESHNLKKFGYRTAQDIIENCSMVWRGDIILNIFPETVAMHLIEGNQDIVNEFMKNKNGELRLTVLQVYSQCEFKLDTVERGLSSGSSHAIFLAASVSEQQVSSKRVADLKEKETVPVVNLINEEKFTYGILYVFSPCAFSIGLLKRTCPHLSEDSITDDYKIIVALRGY